MESLEPRASSPLGLPSAADAMVVAKMPMAALALIKLKVVMLEESEGVEFAGQIKRWKAIVEKGDT